MKNVFEAQARSLLATINEMVMEGSNEHPFDTVCDIDVSWDIATNHLELNAQVCRYADKEWHKVTLRLEKPK